VAALDRQDRNFVIRPALTVEVDGVGGAVRVGVLDAVVEAVLVLNPSEAIRRVAGTGGRARWPGRPQ
jgi:hypothetical protein